MPLKENCIKYKDTNSSNVKEGKKKYGTNTNPKKAVVAILMSAKVYSIKKKERERLLYSITRSKGFIS